MKITDLRLENFKCFSKADLKLNKLTLLTGANSSGKSSIIYSILCALQSNGFPLNLSTNGKYVNMGNFEDVSFLHKKTNVIKIGFSIHDDSIGEQKTAIEMDTYWSFDKQRKLPILSKFIISEEFYTYSLTRIQEKKLRLEFTYNRDKDPGKDVNTWDLHKKIDSFLNSIGRDKSGKEVPSTYLKTFEKRFNKNDKKIEFTINSVDQLNKEVNKKGSYALNEINTRLLKLFGSIDKKNNYISSFRFHPQKIRNEITSADLRIGKYGDNYEDQILAWETKKTDEFKGLIASLKKLGLLENIKATRVHGGNYELRIKTHSNSVYSSLTDVGFGISQFLPIIVSDLQLGKNSTLFISQPEIHLHPKVQSVFGEYLLSQISKQNKSYVIETHSEYLINHIRLLIVQKKLAPSDVSIYFFKKNGNKVEQFELIFAEDGQIKNAPKDFFDTYMVDVMEIALNA